MRVVFRFVGLLVLAGAFAALIVDATRSIAAGHIAVVPLGDTLIKVWPTGFQQFRHLVETKLPYLWDPVLVAVLLLPTWVVLGAIGFVLLAATRQRAATIGFVRR